MAAAFGRGGVRGRQAAASTGGCSPGEWAELTGRRRHDRGSSWVGREIVLDAGAVAHGGSCVARYRGRAVFVRHTLPGERVRALVTDGSEGDRFWRADAIEVLDASPDRVQPPCPYAGPGRCGGCDWQHASLAAQRTLKAAVVAEQLHRLAGIDWDVVVEPVPVSPGGLDDDESGRDDRENPEDGLGWRTRVGYAVDGTGRAGLRQHRSHDIVPIETCLIADSAISSAGVEAARWPAGAAVEAVASGTGERLVIVSGVSGTRRLPDLGPAISVARHDDDGSLRRVRGRTYVTERAAGRDWRVTGGGFWQIHPAAADTLVDAVLDAVRPAPGERALDLYSGVGLFAAALAARVGPRGSVRAVEGSRQAVADARRNLHDQPCVELVTGRVERALVRDAAGTSGWDTVDIVVLDPPRTGAKAAVVAAIAERAPRVVAYVACDPAALARDLATFGEYGYRLAGLRAFDLFPMTHHVECVAQLVKSDSGVR